MVAGRSTRSFAASVALVLAPVASPAPAQDLTTTQLEDHAQVVRQDMLTRSLLRQHQGSISRSGGSGLSPEARATCRNKHRAATNLGPNHPKVRRLYALCAQAGY